MNDDSGPLHMDRREQEGEVRERERERNNLTISVVTVKLMVSILQWEQQERSFFFCAES